MISFLTGNLFLNIRQESFRFVSQAKLTSVIYSNVYYILRQTAKHEKVMDKLKELFTITHVLPMDKEVVLNALNSGFLDIEDALQNFSAVKYGGIDVILTRNLKDYKKSEIGVLTPETYVKAYNIGI